MLKKCFANLLLIVLPVFGDTVLARTEVPNSLIPQGEVRLVERGAETVVQSIIQTRFPGRVLAKIVKSERENWPGNAEMERYVAALEAAFSEYGTLQKDAVLAIDFVAGPGGTRVDFFFPPGTNTWRSLPLSPAYVQRNQECILADAFGKKSAEVIQTLRKLSPMEETHE